MPGPKTTRRGVDVAGRVEAVGKDVKDLRPGDDVFGWCSGAFAEYAAAPADHFVLKPSRMTYEEGAAAPVAAVTALLSLRDKGELQAGQRVLARREASGRSRCRSPKHWAPVRSPMCAARGTWTWSGPWAQTS